MSSRAFDRDTTARRSRNFRDDSQRDPFAFQDGSLFDVQFHECLVIAIRQFNVFQFSPQTCFLADTVEQLSITVSQLSGGFGRETSGE